ncbi:MAG: WG repeat-containing protein [Burkholderiales bacterium]|nr:WG repeat-containing protein [Bacteroidia bacterium]
MRKIIVVVIICLVSKLWGNKISGAFEALSVYDYFKAKQLFYKAHKKYPCESSYGLATIFYRSDNPFSNIDSAAKYIAVAKNQFKDTVTFLTYHINKQSINDLVQKISYKGFGTYGNTGSVNDLNHYLKHFYFSTDSLLSESYFRRDELRLNNVVSYHSSDSVRQFLLNHPESWIYSKAQTLFYDFQFTEKTPQKSKNQLQQFITQFSRNPHVPEAEMSLFNFTQQFHSADSLYNFIKIYSSNLTNEAAWKLLYSLSVKQYSKEELTGFLQKYPDYPYNQTLLKEISLTQNVLILVKNLNDKSGFIDSLGNWVIQPQFDDALPFNEGFASVCKNDSCFYINKEGLKISDHFFEEAESYKDGIAIAKKDSVCFLINRSGQIISKGYQDINESSHQLYVCKLNNVYGAINAKGEIIIPFSYTKLGNFKNKFAYYLSTQYGLVDIHNKALPALWDWISDVDSNSIAIVKKKNQFGLMDVDGQVILPTEYDYVTHCRDEIYLVVKNRLYGFYNVKEKCFVTSVDYDYNSSFEASYYTNGKSFKLIRDDEVALVDANGRYSINFGNYTNLFFAKDDIIRIQKNNKYGFVDRKLKAVTAVEFDKAKDFEDNCAVVAKGVNTSLIDRTGKSIYTIKNAEIINAGNGLYKVKQNNLSGLIGASGKQLLNLEFESIQPIHQRFYLCIKNNELYFFNPATKLLKKL